MALWFVVERSWVLRAPENDGRALGVLRAVDESGYAVAEMLKDVEDRGLEPDDFYAVDPKQAKRLFGDTLRHDATRAWIPGRWVRAILETDEDE